jgi:hypothetical protein
MAARFEVPPDEVLADLPVEVVRHDEPWVTTVRSTADDGVVVDLTWDQMAASISVLVRRGDAEIARLEREAIVQVRVFESHAGVHFEAELSTDGLRGVLGVDIGSTVLVRDVVLRR